MSSQDGLTIGLDVSTTAAKALVVDASGRVIAEGKATFPLDNPAPGAWEQDARTWLAAALHALREALAQLGEGGRRRVRAIAIAHQRETFVVTDQAGAPLAPAIVWMDARSTPEVEAACRELPASTIHRISGKVPCTTPSLYKMRMLLGRLSPGLRARDKRVVDVHGYLVHALSGHWITSTASADPLGVVDMQKGEYSEELCALAGVRPSELAALVPPGSVIGCLAPAIAKNLELPDDVQLVAGAGDGQAAGLGAGVVDEGVAYLNLGTAIVAGTPGRAYRTARSYRTLFSGVPGMFLYETDLKGGTLTLDWLADRLLGSGRFERNEGRASTLAELEALAQSIAPGAGGLMALPYWAGVMNPHWDDDAGGALVGLRADHGPEHVHRAICEGLAFEQRLAFELLEADVGPLSRIVTMGGASRRDFFLGIVCAVLGRSLARSLVDETTALGAAVLAAPIAGVAESIESAARHWGAVGETVEPGPEAARYDQLYKGAYRGLYEALAPALKALAAARA